jgi:uncharacterized protein (DUF2235 family)
MCNKDNQARCAFMLRELLQVDPARVEFVDQERRNVLMFEEWNRLASSRLTSDSRTYAGAYGGPMAKNIIIFSDGTGQAGGITFDEVRTNVYKLYRACRVGPDTTIDPVEQVAFYDPGLGSPADGSKIKIHWDRAIYNLASKATGLGITANIIDC